MTHLERTGVIQSFVPWNVRSNHASRPTEEITTVRSIAGFTHSWFIHLPDIVVAVGVSTGAGEQRPVGSLAYIIIIKPLDSACPSIVKADRDAFVARLAVQRGFSGLQQVVVLHIQSIVMIPRSVRGLEHIEVEPRGLVQLNRRKAGSDWVESFQMRAAIAFAKACGHRIYDRAL